jgi:hypothetical protein
MLVEAACPVPIRRDKVPLPSGVGFFDDEFVVAATHQEEMSSERVVLTTQRLLRSHGPGMKRHQVINLADVRSVGLHEAHFSDTGKVVLETVGGSTVSVPALDELVPPDTLLALVRYARSREAHATDISERIGVLGHLRDTGAISPGEFDTAKAALLARAALLVRM